MNHRILLLFVLILIILALPLYGYRNGITGRTQVGCTCHGNSPSSTTSLSAESSSGVFRTRPGQTLNITVTVANNILQAAGINIAVQNQNGQNAGTLAPETGSGLQASSNELTHSSPKNMSNGQASFSFRWTAPNTGGDYILRAVGNAVNGNGSTSGDAWNYLTPVTMTVADLVVVAPNGGEVWCLGSSQTIRWNSSGVQNIRILISSDGGQNWSTLADNVAASLGSWTWNIPNTLVQGSQYKVKIVDVSDTTFTDESNANFSIATPPQITQQPSSVTVCEGQTVTLRVSAQGTGLSYQWRKDGSNVPGATQATYTFNATTSSGGAYSCVVSNNCGSVTSELATVLVKELPKITKQPSSVTVCEGELVTLSLTAQGSGLSYQWKKDGNNIQGATQPTYQFSATPSGAGAYSCEVRNECGTVTSESVNVTVNIPPRITLQPKPANVKVGEVVTFSLSATGSQPLIFQWRKNGDDIPDANDSVFTIQSAKLTDAGYYDCKVTNVCGEVLSQIVQLTVTKVGEPMLSLKQDLVDFEYVEVMDDKKIDLEGIIFNSGDDTLVVSEMKIEGEHFESFEIVSGNAPFKLSPNQEHTLVVKFLPKKEGLHLASINFTANVSNTPVLQLKGFGVMPTLEVSATNLNFGSINLNSVSIKEIEIRNNLPLDLQITGLLVEGEGFELGSTPNIPFVLSSNSSLNIVVRFTPMEPKEYSSNLYIAFSGKKNSDTITIQLVGIGFEPSSVGAFDSSRKEILEIYPIPINSKAKVRFSLPEHSGKPDKIQVKLFDVFNREVASLIDDFISGAYTELVFDAKYLDNGIYFLVLEYDNFVEYKKIIIAK